MTHPAADLSALVDLASEITREVGDHLVRSLDGAGPVVQSKSTITDLVTDLDQWAERRITERLLDVRPDDGVEGEEGAAIVGTSGITWCVDPIDGTVNFVHGLPGFCVSIAARSRDATVAGVVYSPLHQDLFDATRGGGARRNGKTIRASAATSLDRSLIGTGFAYDAETRSRQAAIVAEVIGRIADVRRLGAGALDLCMVACGRLDGYWEIGLNPWDYAAGALIAEEAGARVLVDDPADRPSYTVAAAPGIWSDLNRLLDEVGATEV